MGSAAHFLQDPGQGKKAFADQLIVLAHRLAEQLNILVNHFIVSAYFHAHGIALQANPVNERVGRIVKFFIAVGFPKIKFGPTDQDSQVQNPMDGQLFGLTGPFLAGMAPDLGRYINPAPVVPLGQPQRKPLGVRLIGNPAIDIFVILADENRFLFQVCRYFHVNPFRSVVLVNY